MLKKITLKQYILVSVVVLLIALIVQMSMGKDCAWDGCYATTRPTIVGSLFGLPALVLQIEIFLGLILWIIRRAK